MGHKKFLTIVSYVLLLFAGLNVDHVEGMFSCGKKEQGDPRDKKTLSAVNSLVGKLHKIEDSRAKIHLGAGGDSRRTFDRKWKTLVRLDQTKRKLEPELQHHVTELESDEAYQTFAKSYYRRATFVDARKLPIEAFKGEFGIWDVSHDGNGFIYWIEACVGVERHIFADASSRYIHAKSLMRSLCIFDQKQLQATYALHRAKKKKEEEEEKKARWR